MFDNINSDNAERRHIKFPIVCSKLDGKTKPFMICDLLDKFEKFCSKSYERNVSAANVAIASKLLTDV